MSAGGERRGLSQNKKFLGKRVLKECMTSGKGDNFVLIDVESDNLHDIIIIDVPEPSQKRLKKPPAHKIINIDDDEEIADESSNASKNSGSGDECCTMPMHSSNIGHQKNKDSSFVNEINTPVNLSKFKRTYSQKSGTSNCYWFDLESENVSSESDCSDFELMEGFSGKLREQWEKAFLKRKCSGIKNKAGTSGPHPDSVSINWRNKETKESECLDSTSAADMNDNKENLFASDVDGGCSSLNDNMDNPLADSSRAFPEQVLCSWEGTDAQGTYGLPKEDNTCECTEKSPYLDIECGVSPDYAYKHRVQGPAVSNADRVDQANSYEVEPNIIHEHCSYNRQPSFDEQFDYDMADAFVEKSQNLRTQLSGDADGGCERIPFVNVDEELTESGSCSTPSNEIPSSSEQDKFMPDNTLAQNSDFFNEWDGKEGTTACCRGSSLHYHQSTDTTNNSPLVADTYACELSDSPKFGEKNDMTCGLGAETSPNDIIIDRQKIKETDEYKRAMEEEWASRHHELQIQAEEAQRLRRRRKAETMRIMDVERRQRQRLEEVRETQKKDEENLNLKERLRVEIRNELNQLEKTCSDMASLLKKLGIHVGGGFLHSQNEVQAAYKRALLKFHPDRASRTDMRQQVEAEEKFKLISRMKESFSFVR